MHARHLHTIVWVAGISLILVCSMALLMGLPHSIAGIALFSPAANPIVLGPVVIDNPPLFAIELLLVIGLACLPTSAVLRHHATATGAIAARRVPRALAAIASSALTFLVGALLLLCALIIGVSDPVILPERSPAGARIVVIDRAFLLVGKGDVYYAPPHTIFTTHLGSYTADDGYNPVARGTYRLTWNGEQPELTFDDPAGYARYYPDTGKRQPDAR